MGGGSDKELIFRVTTFLAALRTTLYKHNREGSVDFSDEIGTIDELLREAERYLESNPKHEVSLWAAVPGLVERLLDLLNLLLN
jgi:hypothetical protein